MNRLLYVCEVCGKTSLMTPEEAYMNGWDYPPMFGKYGEISPRTCPDCPLMETAWAALELKKMEYKYLSDKQKEAIRRIQREPENMFPEGDA